MFKISSEKELLDCFREIDRQELILAPELKFPLIAKDYLTWLEPSGCRVYLVFHGENFKAPFGMVFRRDQTLGPTVAAMCEWCHSVRSGNEVGVLTVTSSNHKRVGISLCRDLSCSEKIRSTPGPNDFHSTGVALQERIRKLIGKMTTFVQRELI